jgi:hypothetical protein
MIYRLTSDAELSEIIMEINDLRKFDAYALAKASVAISQKVSDFSIQR